MGKNLINEDIRKMMTLIGYDRGKTLTENKEQIDEILPAAAFIPAGVTAAAKTAAAIGATIYGIWYGMDEYFSDKTDAERIDVALTGQLWPKMEELIKSTSYSLGKDIEPDLDIIDKSTAKQYADILFDAFNITFGTDEDAITEVMSNINSLIDLSRVAYEYGTKDGNNLKEELDDELGAKDYNRYVGNVLKNVPLAIFENKQYDDFESFSNAIGEKYAEKEEEEVDDYSEVKNKFSKYPCVQKAIDDAVEVVYPYKEKDNQVYLKLENGDLALFSTGGKYVARVGGKKTNGTIECPDDFSIEDESEEELMISESMGLFEQVMFGGVQLNPDVEEETTDDTEEETTDDDGGGTGGETGGGSKYRRTAVTYNDVLEGKGTAELYDKGGVVEEIQKKLNILLKLGLKLDGAYGPKTKKAVERFQIKFDLTDDGIFKQETAKKLDEELKKLEQPQQPEPTPQEPEPVPQTDNQEIEVVYEDAIEAPETIESQIDGLQQEIQEQPSRQQCKTLIGTAAAALKKDGTPREDLKNNLSICYNLYDFISPNSNKVRKGYGLKRGGNITK
jgi:peptidoglycan hydrolase-like protein with peptidoglycan-binding domain